jgi:O-methyltransferase
MSNTSNGESRSVAREKLRSLLRRAGIFHPLRVAKQRAAYWMQELRHPLASRGWVPPQALFETYCRAIALVRERTRAPLGDYLEFGVHHGDSLAIMHRAVTVMRAHEMRLFGFDSWKGLPEEAEQEDDGVWYPGQFMSSLAIAKLHLRRAGIDWRRTTLVKGFYKETLTPDLRMRLGLIKASVIMIDCDLYSSARQALDFSAPLIRDRAVILFDDFLDAGLAERNKGEKLAFDEMLALNPALVVEEELPTYNPQYAKVFVVARHQTGAEMSFASRRVLAAS